MDADGNWSRQTDGGVKTIEALGAVKLLSGGSMSVAAVDDLHQATSRDLNLVIGDKYNATVGGDMQERIQGLRNSVAGLGSGWSRLKTGSTLKALTSFRWCVVCST